MQETDQEEPEVSSQAPKSSPDLGPQELRDEGRKLKQQKEAWPPNDGLRHMNPLERCSSDQLKEGSCDSKDGRAISRMDEGFSKEIPLWAPHG